MYPAQTIADYLLAKGAKRKEENDISNLKLQKLLYYAQGFSLALLGEPCFEDDIQRWTHGPVVPAVYAKYKSCGANILPSPIGFQVGVIDARTRGVLDEVLEVYGQFSPWRLREMTHEEAPWLSVGSRQSIPHAIMKSFFATRVLG